MKLAGAILIVRTDSDEIRKRQWTEAEIEALRRASEAQAAGRDLPEAEYEDIPRLTEEQLAGMVRFRDVRRGRSTLDMVAEKADDQRIP